MERQYRAMYRLGLRPWDQVPIPAALRARVEGAQARDPAIALDIGCGTGRHAAYLARHGWDVYAFDISSEAIAQARNREPRVQWQVADVASVAASHLLDPYLGRVELVVDIGCLHGLDSPGRVAWAELVAEVAAPAAQVLVRANPPSRRAFLPRGISSADIHVLLGDDWELLRGRAGEDADGTYVFTRTRATTGEATDEGDWQDG